MKQTLSLFLILSLVSQFGFGQVQKQPSSNSSAQLQEFTTPPNSAKPRVWWHWMNGNITKDGIQKDLEWMNRVGIGGFQNFDANLFTPVVVPKKLVFMTPEWKDAFRFTTEQASQKGLEMAIAGSPGWSVTGGPWVEPKDAMKKYVWTQTNVAGGKAFTGKLPQPAPITGPFQNIKLESGGLTGGFVGTVPSFYQDAIVIAYKVPASEKNLTELNPKVSSSGGSFTLTELTDGDLGKTTFLPPLAVGEDMYIQYAFDTPQTFKALSIVGAIKGPLAEFRGGNENRTLQVSDDGMSFRDVAKVPGSIAAQNTVSFPATTAKFWRMAIKTLPPPTNPFGGLMGQRGGEAKSEGVNVAEFVLYNTDRIDQYEDKAGFTPYKEDTKTAITSRADAIPTEDVVDLTSKMQPDGTLNWTAPAGNWVVMRFGYSLTGRQNHPASPEATGLEVDKLDKEAVRKYINTYLDMYKDATGGMMGSKGLQYMVLDSYEAGHMNWTKSFPEEFQKRRGYTIQPWLPVLAGRVIKSTDASEKFLWDFRKTIGELITESHYEVIGDELHKRGMKRYTESHEGGRIYLADGMDVKRYADVPMSAMWTPGSLAGGSDEEVRSEGDIRESASVANIYGQNILAAESMTAAGNAFSSYPEKLKRTADLEMASGLNRFVIHTSVHQPLDDKLPGFSLGPFGQWYTRQETWAEPGKAWIAYLGRSCYLLQQGRNVADVLYYYGQNYNITWITREKLPAIPTGYEFDFVNASALLNAVSVKNGQLVAKSGNTYRLLVLDESAKNMTLPVLKKLRELVKAGAKVVGTKPEQSPSLSDNPAEFQTIVNEIWASPNVVKGSIADALKAQSVAEDVIVKNATSKILYRHRQTADQDIYWLDNRSDNPTPAEVSFRVTGKVPMLWNPQTGKTETVTYKIKDGRTIVPLQFESWDAYFIVFSGKASTMAYTKPAEKTGELLTISTPWTVRFQENRSAPPQATFASLASWTNNSDPGIKYFSGTATYDNSFNVALVDKSAHYVLDLGDVKNIAEVTVNGQNMGIIWKKPFRVDVTSALKTGANNVSIKVTNTWVNRLVGDQQPDVKQKITFATMPFYKADSPLLPSGLLGPVRVLTTTSASTAGEAKR
ncbi:glycoside hydrolase [Spirosoma sp. BT702]|uniref:Glycoside hydrolase n=1 Tax=Spirosoma profusum TaxID=2771354 RepID=A0A926XYV4_9BACT|nr:glycosyl hydrolase [Spirosoma profusum]MBD2702721.1 glycoside hydrolase [Spirosoma profusum]